jgi:hypothetical protein
MRMMSVKMVVFAHEEEGINVQDESYTFVSVKFSRSFV